MMNKIATTFLLLTAPFIYAQENKEPLPSGYRSIELGATMENVKEALTNDDYFIYKGEPDVTMIEEPDRSSIEVRGAGFIKSAYFLFYDDKLYTIIIEMRQDRLDYNTVYKSLVEKYGEATDLDPDASYWEDSRVKVILEKPLFIKFLDKDIFDQLQERSQIVQNYRSMARDNFLKSF